MLSKVSLVASYFSEEQRQYLHKKFQFEAIDCQPEDASAAYVLMQDDLGIYVQQIGSKAPGPVRASFIEGAQAHRRLVPGAELIIKALGAKQSNPPTVIDLTAGLGRDSFVMANWGCHVVMCERSAVAACLLEDGLLQATRLNDVALHAVVNRMTLFYGTAKTLIKEQVVPEVDVAYIDPMFPESKKSAAVKKEMRVFHDVIGADEDSAELLELGLAIAKKRVVVKRPKKAEFLANQKPTMQVIGKSVRFDIYTKQKMI